MNDAQIFTYLKERDMMDDLKANKDPLNLPFSFIAESTTESIDSADVMSPEDDDDNDSAGFMLFCDSHDAEQDQVKEDEIYVYENHSYDSDSSVDLEIDVYPLQMMLHSERLQLTATDTNITLSVEDDDDDDNWWIADEYYDHKDIDLHDQSAFVYFGVLV